VPVENLKKNWSIIGEDMDKSKMAFLWPMMYIDAF